MLKELKREHHITYLALDDGSAGAEAREHAYEYCHELICLPHRQREKFSPGFYAELLLNLVSPFPYAIKKYESDSMRRKIVEQASKGTVDVVICDFLAPAINVPRSLPCSSILFQHNVEAMIWKRHFEVQNNSLKRWYLRRQWRKMYNFEKQMCRRFDSVIAVSKEDSDLMREEYGVDEVFDVPTGVDTEFFRPSDAEVKKPNNVVFTGSMDWLPNEDAIHYYTEQILPLIRQSVPDATLTVVGRNPYPGLLELSKRDPAIEVTGRVEDVRPYMERAAAYAVPLRIGGGTRLKIYEAMAMRKATVSTAIGAEGLDVEDGRDILLADDAPRFAEAIIRLVRDDGLRRRIEDAAAHKAALYDWSLIAGRFAEILERVARTTKENTVERAARVSSAAM